MKRLRAVKNWFLGKGGGAGPYWHGQSGIHSHMTNTRITDPEIFERRYPVLLKKFVLRKNSGGKGFFNGGEGVVRKVVFLKNISVSLLTERRVFAPNGILGGSDGEKGKNILKKGKNKIYLGSKNFIDVSAGD
jgi:5-oxoprolinase (ATP-hydrolysing)